MKVRYASIFKACTKVALNALIIRRAPKACTWASKTNVFQFPFTPIRVYQIDAPYVIWGIITALNILWKAR